MNRIKRRLILAGRIARGLIVGIPAAFAAYMGWFVLRAAAGLDRELLEKRSGGRVWLPADKPERGE